MTQRRLLDDEVVDPAHESTARLLRALPRRATSAPGRVESEWRDIEAKARAARPTRPLVLVVAAVGSAMVGSAVTLALLRPLPAKPAPERVAWRTAAGTELRREAGVLRLESGKLAGLPSEQPTRCATPFGDAVWSDARFLLEVSRQRALLSVESGAVEWRDGRGVQRIIAGQTLELPPAGVELPASLREAMTGATDCAADDRSCLAQRAAGSSLDAENALFELALLEGEPLRSLDHLREYQRRFPRGIFAAEVDVACIVALAQLGRRVEAAAAVARFRKDHPSDPLLPSVELISRQLETHP